MEMCRKILLDAMELQNFGLRRMMIIDADLALSPILRGNLESLRPNFGLPFVL
jgi:hypothetical protein